MRRFSVVMVFLVVVSCVFAESATMLGAIEEEYQKGMITLDEAMLFKAYSVVDHSRLPGRFQKLESPKCGTPTLAEIFQNMEYLKKQTRVLLREVLARPTGLPQSIETTHFKFHYTTSGGDAVSGDTYVNNMGTRFENSYDLLLSTRGYLEPPSDGTAGGNSKYDVYIMSLSSGVLGYTQPEVEGSYPWSDATSFIAMRNNYTWYPPEMATLEVTAVHEYFHAIQFGYSYSQPGWYMEVSSVWIEDEMYPSNNDEHDYDGEFFPVPHISLTRNPSDPTYGMHCYGSYNWNVYLSEKFGDDAILDIWDNCKSYSVMTAFQNVAAGHSSSRSSAFAEFCVWNYFTGSRDLAGLYPEGDLLPLVHIERTVSSLSYPASGSSGHPPEAFASNYIVFSIPGGASGPFSVTFDGDDGANWIAQLVIPGAATPYDTRLFPLNAYGYGYLTLTEAEYTGHSELILVVSNISTSGGGSNFSYNADFAEIEPTYEPPTNLVAESGHVGEVPLSWDPPPGGGVGGTIELYNDDGSPLYYLPYDLAEIGYPEAGHVIYEGVKFNASSDCTLKQVNVYFGGTAREVGFFVSADEGGYPGSPIGTPFNLAVTTGAWTTIDVPSGVPIPAGDFWLGYTRMSDDIFAYMDAETTAGTPSIAMTDSSYAIPVQDYLMRAIITSPGGALEVTGYNIHRSYSTGGPYSSVGNASTESWTDHSVIDETAYYYVVSATYSDAGESNYSNEDMAVPGVGAGGDNDTLAHHGDLPDGYFPLSVYWEGAVVFEPDEPCQLMALRYLVYPDEFSTWEFGVGLYRWTGSRIAESYIAPFPTDVNPGADGWTEIDMSLDEIYFSGGFAASFISTDTLVSILVDTMDDDYSYIYEPDAEIWFGSDYRFFIEAVVRYLDGSETYTVSGIVSLAPGSGGSEPPDDLSGSIVRVIETSDVDTTDEYGVYSLDLPSGVYTLEAWYPGYVPQDAVVGLTGDATQDFYLMPYSTPLNPVFRAQAWSYDNSEVFITWDPPLGFAGTEEQIYFFNPYSDTLIYLDSLSIGDIFDNKFTVWFPCTLKNAGITFYSEAGIYPDVSVHIWGDDGTGYPDFGVELLESLIIHPEPDSLGYVQWTDIDFAGDEIILWPGQVIHLGVRLLSNYYPSVIASGREPTYDPAISMWYSEDASAWFNQGEFLEYIEVVYFSGDMARISPFDDDFKAINPVSKVYYPAETFANRSSDELYFTETKALYSPTPAFSFAPTETEALSHYLIYHSTSYEGSRDIMDYDLIGTVDTPDSFGFLHEDAENGIVHYYYVVAGYDHGYSESSDTVSALPLESEDSAWVLLVDDDGSNFMIIGEETMAPDEGIELAQILINLGIPFDAIELPPGYYISDEDLDDYQAVLWNCGIGYTDNWTLGDSEQVNIARYLDGGGKYALFSQDFIWDYYGATVAFGMGDFIYDYLGVSSVVQDFWTITGPVGGTFAGFDFADGMELGVTNPYSDWTVYADRITGIEDDSFMTLDIAGNSGALGVVYDDAGFMSAFFACTPFAMTDDTPDTKQEFIRRLLEDYFDVHDPSLVESVTVNYDLCAGWHMLSVPVIPGDITTDNVFPGNAAVYTWNPITEEYISPTNIEPGVGYFVLFDSETSFDIVGVAVDTFEIELNCLWNMIGVPFKSSGSFSFDDASYTPDNFINGSYFGMSGEFQTYIIPDNAEVGMGYWAAVWDYCTLEFPGDARLLKATSIKSTLSGSPPPPPFNLIPKTFAVGDIYPNPFNSACALDVSIPKTGDVRFDVLDMTGRIIYSISDNLKTGNHRFTWHGTDSSGDNCPSGVYFVTVRFCDTKIQRRALLLK